MSEAQEEAKRSTAAMVMDGPHATSPLAPDEQNGLEMCERTVHKSAGWTSQPTVWNPVSVRQHRHRSRPRHHVVSSRLSPATLLVDASTMHKGVFVCKENSSSPWCIFWQLSGRWCWVAPPRPSQSLVILCNCLVWCELGRRRASLVPTLPQRWVQRTVLGPGCQRAVCFRRKAEEGFFFSFWSEGWSQRKTEGREKGRCARQNMQDSRTSCVWLWARRTGEDWVKAVLLVVVVVVVGLDKHNMSAAEWRAALHPHVPFSSWPAAFVDMYLHLQASCADWQIAWWASNVCTCYNRLWTSRIPNGICESQTLHCGLMYLF